MNSSLSNRGTAGFSSSISGHVTPTSGMFPISNSFNQQQQNQPPQLSPNRNVSQYTGTIGAAVTTSGQMLPANRAANMINQRTFGDRRPIPGMPPGPMVSLHIFVCFYVDQ